MQRTRGASFVQALVAMALTAGCGGRATDNGPDRPEPPTDGECRQLSWDSCVQFGETQTVIDGGDNPSLVWTGSVFLLGFQARSSETSPPPAVVTLNASGQVLDDSPLSGALNWVRLAYHPKLGRALGLYDSGAAWFDEQGTLLGVEDISGIRFASGDVSLLEDGFLALASDHASPHQLLASQVDGSPGALQWTTVRSSEESSYFEAAHLSGPEGLVSHVLVSDGQPSENLLYEVDAHGTLHLTEDLTPHRPNGGYGRFRAVFTHEGGLFGLYGGTVSNAGSAVALWLVNLSSPAVDAQRIDRSPNGAEISIIPLGSDIVGASSAVHPEVQVSLFELSPGSEEPVSSLTVLGDAGKYSRSATLARLPGGFAVAWTEFDGDLATPAALGLPKIRIAQFDCCAE